jgi:hypothetical protein
MYLKFLNRNLNKNAKIGIPISFGLVFVENLAMGIRKNKDFIWEQAIQ